MTDDAYWEKYVNSKKPSLEDEHKAYFERWRREIQKMDLERMSVRKGAEVMMPGIFRRYPIGKTMSCAPHLPLRRTPHTMRLARHEELVEVMALALRQRIGFVSTIDMAAALDALLEAAVRLGVGRDASLSVSDGDRWTAYQGKQVSYSPALILRMEERTNDA